MKFKINDKVSVLDDDINGIILCIRGSEITVATSTGFDLVFDSSELVKINENLMSSNTLFSKTSINNVLIEKDSNKKQIPSKLFFNDRNKSVIEVDLHLNQLIKNTRGMQNHEMLNLQLETAKWRLEAAIKQRIQRIIFIHGVGEGVLKIELEYLFNRYDGIKYYDANYQKYGQGATEVYILQSKTT
jgi:hypothetical protein